LLASDEEIVAGKEHMTYECAQEYCENDVPILASVPIQKLSFDCFTECDQDVGNKEPENEVDLVGIFNFSRIFTEYLLDYNFVLVNDD
jgi:hypothetical protein